MTTVAERILDKAKRLPRGSLITREMLLTKFKFSESAVDKSLHKLVKRNHLIRAYSGAYLKKGFNRYGTQIPDHEAVIASFREITGETVVLHGAIEAKRLGLTQQVASKLAYLTSGRNRIIKLGKVEVILKHGSNWQLALGSRPAGAAIRAIGWMGEYHVEDTLPAVCRILPQSEWDELIHFSPDHLHVGWV